MSLTSPLFFPGTLLLVLIVIVGVISARPMPLSCSAWTTGECLSWHDGRVGQLRNLSSPRSCCDACNQVAKCRAWSLYGAEHGGNNTYCDLYASDKPDRFKCKQGISSLSNDPPVPPSPPPKPVPPPPPPKPGTIPLNVLLLVVDDLRYQFGFEGPGATGPGCSAPSSPDPAGFFPACGKMHTPALDKLVSSPGTTVFARNYVQQAVCSASRASVLTSRRPDSTNWGGGYWRITAGNWSTLPEAFRRSGYITKGCGKIFHGGPHSGNRQQGLQPDDAGPEPGTYSWSVPYFHAEAAMKHYPYGDCKSERDFECSINSWRAVSPEEEAAHPLEATVLADHAIETLQNISTQRSNESSPKPQPFFLGVGFHRPHLPFVFPAKNLDLYPRETIQLPQHRTAPEGMPAVAWSNWVSIEAKSYADINRLINSSKLNASGFDGHGLGLPGVQLPESQQIDMRRAYYAAVSHTDAQIGRVLAALTETGLRNNTVVCIFADHGWSLGEHGEWAKHTNFELDVHAPWILSLPHPTRPRPEAALKPNNMVSLYTEHVDIMPTLLEAAAGVVLPPCEVNSSANLCTMGRSRVGLLDGTPSALSSAEIEIMMASEDNAAFSQYERPYAGANGSSPVLNTSWCALGSGEGGDPACTVGYSMVGLYSGSDEELRGEYRYTEWIGFNTAQAPRRRDWNDNAGTELYRHQNSTIENVNLADDPKYTDVRLDFSRRLRKGPPTSGWGLPPS